MCSLQISLKVRYTIDIILNSITYYAPCLVSRVTNTINGIYSIIRQQVCNITKFYTLIQHNRFKTWLLCSFTICNFPNLCEPKSTLVYLNTATDLLLVNVYIKENLKTYNLLVITMQMIYFTQLIKYGYIYSIINQVPVRLSYQILYERLIISFLTFPFIQLETVYCDYRCLNALFIFLCAMWQNYILFYSLQCFCASLPTKLVSPPALTCVCG